MAINNFIPQVWSANYLASLKNNLVYGSLADKSYEGEIRNMGDRVHIHTTQPVTVEDYTKNDTELSLEILDDARVTLTIDQAKSFNFFIDDIDAAQQNPKIMMDQLREASYAIANVADQHIAGLAEHAETKIGTDSDGEEIDADNILDLFGEMAEALDEENAFGERVAVIPPWMKTLLLKARGSADTNNTGILANGWVDRQYGIDIYMSNNVASDASPKIWDVMCFIRPAIAYADQIVKIQAYEPQNRFGDAVKGLHVYGANVIRPEGLVTAYVSKASE